MPFWKVNPFASTHQIHCRPRAGWAGGVMIKARDTADFFTSTKREREKKWKQSFRQNAKYRLIWCNEAVWINETNSFYLNHLWCEMGSHIEKSLETLIALHYGKGGGEKTACSSFIWELTKWSAKGSWGPAGAGCRQSGSSDCECSQKAKPESCQETDTLWKVADSVSYKENR